MIAVAGTEPPSGLEAFMKDVDASFAYVKAKEARSHGGSASARYRRALPYGVRCTQWLDPAANFL